MEILFDTQLERDVFVALYSFRFYNLWLEANKLVSTLDNLKTYKNWCYNYVMETVWVV